jgi:uncharacterized protein YndB with AHSA1/START domain
MITTKNEIQHILFFNQTPEEVWSYLTKSELLAGWFMANDFKPIVGHKFQFRSNKKIDCQNEGVAYCEVLEIIPYKLLSYSWKNGTGNEEISLDSVVTWRLSEKNGGTELMLTHNGFVLLKDYVSHSEGWNKIVNRIVQLLNKSRHAEV